MDSPPLQTRCIECGAELAPGLVACPSCGRLLHGKTLKSLAAQAEEAERQGDLSSALAYWRNALTLLPEISRQHDTILQKVRDLSLRVDEGSSAPKPQGWKKGAAGLGGLGLLLFKFKSVLLLLLTKGKFLLLGLTKAKTLFSMLLYLGVYWSLWGWKFALGFVISIYIHEMGHVWMLNRYGIKATAPMFVPGFGAYVRSQRGVPLSAREEARVGLAGPLWGLGAAGACYAIYLATENPVWGGIAQAGGVINLLNLIPVWIFDGSRGFRSLTKVQRLLAALAAGAMYVGTAHENRQNMFLLIIAGFALVKALFDEAPKERDDFGLFQYALLILLLGGLSAISLPGIHF